LGNYLVCNSLNELKFTIFADPYPPFCLAYNAYCDDLISNSCHDNVLWSIPGGIGKPTDGLMSIDLSNPGSPVVSNKQQLVENWDQYNSSKLLRASGNRLAFMNPLFYPPCIKTAVLTGNNYQISEIQIACASMGRIIANDDWIVGLNPVINILEFSNDNKLQIARQIKPESYYCDLLQIKDNLLFYAYTYLYDEKQSRYLFSHPDISICKRSQLGSFPIPYDREGIPHIPFQPEIMVATLCCAAAAAVWYCRFRIPQIRSSLRLF
jgi:hypothetical protein